MQFNDLHGGLSASYDRLNHPFVIDRIGNKLRLKSDTGMRRMVLSVLSGSAQEIGRIHMHARKI